MPHLYICILGSYALVVLAHATVAPATLSSGAGQIARSEAGQSIPPVPFEVGKPVERELKGGETHAYSLRLEAGQYVSAVVDQKGIDVVVTLAGPDGTNVAEVDSPNGAQGPEPVTVIADKTGNYLLNVRSLEAGAAAGRYEARLVEVHTATQKDRTLIEARRLIEQTQMLTARGKRKDALPLAERAAALYEQALGPEHIDLAPALKDLGALYTEAGDFAKAEPLLRRALDIREKSLGPEHRDVAPSLNSLAQLYQARGEYAKAEPLYQRTLAIVEKAYGPEHIDVAATLNNLADFYREHGEYAKAEPLFQRSLAIAEKTLGPEHPYVANALNNLAIVYYFQGRYEKAESLLQRALAIREKVLGPDHPDVADTVSNFAGLYWAMASYDKAETLLQRALASREKVLGSHHPLVAQSLNNLAALYQEQGVYSKAEPLYERALAILEKKFGSEHPAVAQFLNNLADLYRDQGVYAKAEPVLERALAIREKTLGPEHPDVAQTLNNLGLLNRDQGSYEKAEPRLARALAIREKVLGPEHPHVATALNNLALLYQTMGRNEKAEPLFNRSLAIREKAFDPTHPDVATGLSNLASLLWERGDYAKAEPLLERALAIREKALGPDHPGVGISLNNLARLYQAQGRYAKARPLYERALAINEKALGPAHPQVATSLHNLAANVLSEEEPAKALEYQRRGNDARERDLVRNLTSGSERTKRRYLSLRAVELDLTVSLHVRWLPADASASRAALEVILQRKGRALDAMSDAVARLRRNASPEDQRLLDELADLRTRLSTLTLKGAGKEGAQKHAAILASLEERVEISEAQVSQRSVQFRTQLTPVSLDAVQRAVPEDGVLVEFVAYRPFDPTATSKKREFGPPRYVAYVLARAGDPRWVDLGEAAPIDQAVDRLRNALRAPSRRDVRRLARALDKRVMRPVRRLAGPARRLLISPDGALNLVPFAAFVDERGKYLVERFTLSYLTSGRDLLRLGARDISGTTPLVVADPAFGQGPGPALFQPLGPLAGSAEEAKALAQLLPSPLVRMQAAATEQVVREVAHPEILHIATHGFFLADAPEPSPEEYSRLAVRREGAGGSGVDAVGVGRLENPLQKSGLFFAGANHPGTQQGEDGVLTALEVAGMDLWGTRLVVLSACDTGVGEVKNGEGVYGLRRALVLAGSETTMVSLWPVSDTGTRDLMIGFYRKMLAGESRSESLRRVQLQMLKSRTRRHPYYWASFIQSGAWGPLASGAR